MVLDNSALIVVNSKLLFQKDLQEVIDCFREKYGSINSTNAPSDVLVARNLIQEYVKEDGEILYVLKSGRKSLQPAVYRGVRAELATRLDLKDQREQVTQTIDRISQEQGFRNLLFIGGFAGEEVYTLLREVSDAFPQGKYSRFFLEDALAFKRDDPLYKEKTLEHLRRFAIPMTYDPFNGLRVKPREVKVKK